MYYIIRTTAISPLSSVFGQKTTGTPCGRGKIHRFVAKNFRLKFESSQTVLVFGAMNFSKMEWRCAIDLFQVV